MSKLYLYVTNDKYEFPIIVTDSVAKLARMVGRSRCVVYRSLENVRSGRTKRSRYVEVEVDDEQ